MATAASLGRPPFLFASSAAPVRSSPGPCCCCLTYGGDESSEFARQASAFHAAWQQAGNRSELLAQSGANHFTAIAGFEDPASALCRWLAGALSAKT